MTRKKTTKRQTINQFILKRSDKENIVYLEIIRKKEEKKTKQRLKLKKQITNRELKSCRVPRKLFTLEEKQNFYKEYLGGVSIRELAEKHSILITSMHSIIRTVTAKNIVPIKFKK